MGALKQAIKMGRTVFVDLLGAILEKTLVFIKSFQIFTLYISKKKMFLIFSSSWNLDLCMLLLPEIYELLQSQHKL